jgi:hypothetical protein
MNNKESVQVIPASAIMLVPTNDPDHGKTLAEKLAELDTAKQQGHLSQEEYNSLKQTTLNHFTGGSSSVQATRGAVAPVVAQNIERDTGPGPTQKDVVPTNIYHGRQSYSMIMCPVAGHPGFDKGAYHHPVGLCCYTDDISKNIECVCCEAIFLPVTIACYVGTLCYQPCGCICAKEFPYFKDCPFTEQKVTKKFERDHPDKVTRVVNRLVLTRKGSSNQCIFDRSGDLRSGQAVRLALLSHSGMIITKMYPEEKSFGPWRYTESDCQEGGRLEAITVRLEDNEFIKLVDCDLVFDVSFWSMNVGTVVNFVGGSGSGEHRTKLHGGGRSWVVNADGTISCKHHPDLVLGL